MKLFKIQFISSFHIDSGNAVDGPSETFIRSDTLFSAIINATKKIYGSEIMSEFLQTGNLILSSAFPYNNDELFFPKPMNFFPDDLEEYEMIKKFKKVRFISEELLTKILSNEEIDKQFFNKDYFSGAFWSAKKFPENSSSKIFTTQEIPHIVMDRVTNQTSIFYKTEVFFNNGSGLFFLADITDELLRKFETVLRFLGDEGIGADRTIGKGLFKLISVEDFYSPNGESNKYYLLSLYSPTENEFKKIEPQNSYYDFVIRGGWITNNTLNRKNLRMFTEGSILKFSENCNPKGRIWNVLNKDDYPKDLQFDIFRSGQALFLPIRGEI